MKFINRYTRLILLLIFIWVFFILIQSVPMFNRGELLIYLEELANNTHAGIIFIATATLLSIFFVPISWFVATGAILFGLLRGFAYSLTAATIAALISFSLAKALKGNLPELFHSRMKNHRISSYFTNMADKIDNHGLKIMFVLRNVPLFPFVAVNYLSGMSSINFGTFAFGSLLGMVPGIFISTFFFTRIAQTGTDPVGAIIGFTVKLTYILTVLLYEKKSRAKKELIEA